MLGFFSMMTVCDIISGAGEKRCCGPFDVWFIANKYLAQYSKKKDGYIKVVILLSEEGCAISTQI